jgi:hypothetical protein
MSTAIKLPKREALSKVTLEMLQSTEPEYERVQGIMKRFGVSRPFIYDCLKKGVKSIHIKNPGASRGVVIVNVKSMRDFLLSFEGGAQ